MRYSPLAIILASAYFQKSRTTSALDLSFYDTSENSERVTQRWISLQLEEASENTQLLLKFLALLGKSTISSTVIDLCQKSHRRFRNMYIKSEFLTSDSIRKSLGHCMSTGILQRQGSPSGSVYVIPTCARVIIEQQLSRNLEVTEAILQFALQLLAVAQSETSLPLTQGIAESVNQTSSNVRNLCQTARHFSMRPSDTLSQYLQLASLHFLDKTTSAGRRLFKKLVATMACLFQLSSSCL